MTRLIITYTLPFSLILLFPEFGIDFWGSLFFSGTNTKPTAFFRVEKQIPQTLHHLFLVIQDREGYGAKKTAH